MIVQQAGAALKIAVQCQGAPGRRTCAAALVRGARRWHATRVQLGHNVPRTTPIRVGLEDKPHPLRLLWINFQARPDLCRIAVRVHPSRIEHRCQPIAVHPSAIPETFLSLIEHPALDLLLELIQKDFVGQLLSLSLKLVGLLAGVDAVAHRNQSCSMKQDALASLIGFICVAREAAHVIDQEHVE
ncbi:MAG: hypothetical protein NW202_13010 [Nitrospira sp.]|nr:hypothetical protein [Nitrospira sp.]